MNEPLSFYVAPRNAPPLPVQPVPKEQLERWILETEIAPGRGALRRGGRWKIVLASGTAAGEVLPVYLALREAGYAAELTTPRRNTKRAYEVRLAGLPSRDEAQVLGSSLEGKYGIVNPRVRR